MFHLLIGGRSSLHRRSRRFHGFCRHLRWRLLWKRQAEPVEQNGDILLRLNVARQRDNTMIRRRHDDIDHLDCSELLYDLPRRETGRVFACDRPERLEQTQRHERREDVRFDLLRAVQAAGQAIGCSRAGLAPRTRHGIRFRRPLMSR